MATWGELEKAGTKWRDLEEMTWGELEEFCVINPKNKQIPDDMEVSFVPMQSVSDTGAVQTDEVRKASEVKKGFTFFEEGDVLFAKITPCMENGKGGIARGLKNGVGFGSTEFHVLHPAPEKVSSEWLYYLTSWDEFRKQCARNMTGSAGQKRVPKSYLEHYKVHLPSLEEQRRIAAVLDKVSDLIAKRREQLDKLDELVKARFVEMFGDPSANSQWPTQKLSKLGELNRGVSKHRPRNDPALLGGPYPLIQTGDVSNSGLYILDYSSTYSELGLAQSRLWKEGTLCITIAANIAQTSILAFDACFPDSVVGFLPGEKTNAVFVHYWFSFFQKILEEQAPQVAQKNINLKILSDLDVIVPPYNLQADFSDFVRQAEKSKLTIQQSLDKLEVLKKALMQQYFG